MSVYTEGVLLESYSNIATG